MAIPAIIAREVRWWSIEWRIDVGQTLSASVLAHNIAHRLERAKAPITLYRNEEDERDPWTDRRSNGNARTVFEVAASRETPAHAAVR